MLCKNCGAEISEDAKFCPLCGTPADAPVMEAAGDLVDDVRADVTPAVETPVYEAPAAEPPAYEAPAYQPPVYEPPAGGPGGGFVPPPADPGSGPYAGGEGPVKPKKKWLIPAIAAAAVVVVALVLIFALPRLINAAAKPDDYYHKVELKGLDTVTDSAANYYGKLLTLGKKSDDLGVSGSAELSVDKEFFDLVGAGGMDLDWLKSISVDYEINKKDDLTGGEVTLKLNKDKLASLNLLMDQAEQMLYLQVPDVSKNYLGVDMDGMSDDLLYSLRYYLPSSLYYTLGSLMSGVDSESAEQVKAVLEALPSQDQMKKLLDKYMEIAVNSIEDVERDKDTLEAGDVSAEYTTLTVVIDQEVILTIAENVLTALRDDKDVEKYIRSIAEAVEADGDDAYDAFAEELEDALNVVKDSKEDADSKQKITMTLYVDGKGNIVGREIKTSNFDENYKFVYATPVKGGKLGIDISLKQGSETLFAIAGSGKISGSTVSLEATLKAQGSKILDINVEKLDGAKLKQGYIKGVITLKPGADLISQMYLSSSEERMVKKMSLTMDLDTGKGSASAKLILNYDDSPMITLALNSKSASAKKVGKVKDSLDPDDWVDELDEKDLNSFLKNLKKTDIPSEYLDMLEEYIDYLF